MQGSGSGEADGRISIVEEGTQADLLEIVHVKAEKIGCVNTLCAHTPPEGLPGDPQVCMFQLKVLIGP